MAKNIDEYAQTGDQEEACILRQGAIPSRLNRVNIEPLLGQLGGILTKGRSGAGLEEGKGQDSPEHPGQLKHLLELELLILLCQFLVGCCVAPSFVVAVAVLAEEPKHRRGHVGKQVHEH